MTGLKKKIAARFYRSDSGSEPVRLWLLQLDAVDRRTIGKDIQKVECGWPIGMPYSRAIGHGLYEVRSEGDRMILLHGFVKKTQATPAHEIALALKRLKGPLP